MELADSASQSRVCASPEETAEAVATELASNTSCVRHASAISELEALCDSYRDEISDLRAEIIEHERRINELYTRYYAALKRNETLAKELYCSH